jgi:hypothetical protein
MMFFVYLDTFFIGFKFPIGSLFYIAFETFGFKILSRTSPIEQVSFEVVNEVSPRP